MLMRDWAFLIAIPLVFAVVVAGIVAKIVSDRRIARFRAERDRERAARDDAFFQTSFPELQPYYHPFRVLQFVSAWRKRPLAPEGFEWESPPGFDVSRARFAAQGPKGAPVELFDAAGTMVSRFLIQDHDEGGAVRVGPGKLTVNVRNSAVRYWHPQREFKWSLLKGFRMMTSMSSRAIETGDLGMAFSTQTSYSSSDRTAAAAAGVAAVAGAGGAFDGGGSSSSWDESAESRTSY
jgi:hypothetical protein